MRNDLMALSFGIGAMILATDRAFAQQTPSCAPHQAVVERLNSAYGETRHSVGLSVNNTMVEVFASDSTGTWTIIVTAASGMACLVAAGEAFETVADTLPKPGNDA
jgi:hypothetical protein